MAVYWVGQNNNVYYKGDDGKVVDKGSAGQLLPGGQLSNSGVSGLGLTGSFTANRIADPNVKQDSGSYVGGGSGGSGGGSGANAAQERALYDDQIGYLNSILGNVGTQKSAGLQRLQSSAASANQRLQEQQTKTMSGYDEQGVKNAQQKQRGVEQVDSFANSSYNNLQRLLQGANAGNSSVGRQLIPQLVSKTAGTRRQGVFETAGENDQQIASARGDAEDQYKYSFEDLGNQRKQQEEDFLRGVLQQEQDLLGKRSTLEAQKAAATGANYEGTRAATAGTRGEIDARTNQLNALFGQFAPTFQAKAMNLKTPELSQFTVDPGQIKADSKLPGESSYYLTQLRKKQQEQGA